MMENQIITPGLIYWITRLDSIIGFFMFWSVIGGITGCVLLIIGITEEEETTIKYAKKTLLSIIFPILILIFIPSSKEMAAIYLIPKIANSNSAKNIVGATDNATILLQRKMSEWLEEQIQGEKKGGK